jgi:hypothetical protein
MSFPQILNATKVTSISTATSTPTFDLPDEVAAGDLLLFYVSVNDNSITAGPGGNWVEKWIQNGGANNGAGALYALDADGTEGGGTISLTLAANCQCAGEVWRIQTGTWAGNSTNDVEATGDAVSANSSTPTSPSHTASWGAGDNLWFSATAGRDDDASVTAYVPNYDISGLFTVSDGGGNNGATIGVCAREYSTTDTDDPGNFTLSESERCRNVTAVVKPIAATIITHTTTSFEFTAGSHTVSIVGGNVNIYHATSSLELTAGTHVVETIGWLGTYQWRRRVEIPEWYLEGNLQHFPFLFKLGTAAGLNSTDLTDIFTEVGVNSQKIAITESSGMYQLYGEIERWDNSNNEAVLWVSRDNLFLPSGETARFYFYYDNDQDDNTGHVSSTKGVFPACEVWDQYYSGVYHFNESPATGAIDSTKVSSNGTSWECALASGLMGTDSAWEFHRTGTSGSYVDIPFLTSYQDEVLVEMLLNAKEITGADTTFYDAYSGIYWQFSCTDIDFYTRDGAVDDSRDNDLTGWSYPHTDYWYYVAFRYSVSDSDKSVWVSGSLEDFNSTGINRLTEYREDERIGYASDGNFLSGIIDEVRVSAGQGASLAARNGAWIKATEYSLRDDMLQWGAAEEYEAVQDITITHSSSAIQLTAGTHTIATDVIYNHSAENLEFTTGTHSIAIDARISHSTSSMQFTPGTHVVVIDAVHNHTTSLIELTIGAHTTVIDSIVLHTTAALQLEIKTHTALIDEYIHQSTASLEFTPGSHSVAVDIIVPHVSSSIEFTPGSHSVVNDINILHSTSSIEFTPGTHTQLIDVIVSHSTSSIEFAAGTHTVLEDVIITHTASQLEFTPGTHAVTEDAVISHTTSSLELTPGSHSSIIDARIQHSASSLIYSPALPWDSTNCVYLVAPAAWGNGNAPASYNVGTMPIHPNGNYTPATLINCAAGYGIVNDAGDCYLKLDGNNDLLRGGDVAELNSVSTFTIEVWFWQDVLDQVDVIFTKYFSAYYLIQINTSTDGQMYFYCSNGQQYSNGNFDYSTVVSAGQWHCAHMIFNGPGATNADRLKVFIDNSQVTLAYNNDIPATSANLVGEPADIGYLANSLSGRVAWVAIYSDADTSRPAANFPLGRDMGLLGYNNNDVMHLFTRKSPFIVLIDEVIQHSTSSIEFTPGIHTPRVDVVIPHTTSSLEFTPGTHSFTEDISINHSASTIEFTPGTHLLKVDFLHAHTASLIEFTPGTHSVGADVVVQHTTKQLEFTAGVHTLRSDVVVHHGTQSIEFTAGNHSLAIDVLITHSQESIEFTPGAHATLQDTIVEHSTTAIEFTAGTHTVIVDARVSHITSSIELTPGLHRVLTDVIISHTTGSFTFTTGNHAVGTDILIAHSTSNVEFTTGTHSTLIDVMIPHSASSMSFTAGNHSMTEDIIISHSVNDLRFTTGVHSVVVDVIHHHNATPIEFTAGTHAYIIDSIVQHTTKALEFTTGTHVTSIDVLVTHTASTLEFTTGTHSLTSDALITHSTASLELTTGTHTIVISEVVSHTTSTFEFTPGTHRILADVYIIHSLSTLELTAGTHVFSIDRFLTHSTRAIEFTAGTHRIFSAAEEISHATGHTPLDELVGAEVTPEILESLITEGRVSFPPKPTKASAVSQGEDQKDSDAATTAEGNIDEYIDSVKDNEAMVKMLEDMRDDMLKDMKIPPANKDIAEAAKTLGSPDGTIDNNIWLTAQTILDVLHQVQTGNDPIIGAITGNGSLTGDFLQCSEVTQAIANTWNTPTDDSEKTPDELHKENSKRSVTEAKDSFAKKMKNMYKYIRDMLWWNLIWARLVMFFLESTEKIIAIPIDTIFLILRFFEQLTPENYQRYGPIHKLLNRLKILLLCKVPFNAFKEYKPDEDIQVWYPVGKNGQWVSLRQLCSAELDSRECEEGESPWPNDQTDYPSQSVDDKLNGMHSTVYNNFNDDVAKCIPTSFLDRIFPKTEFEGPGMSPECAEAAKKIIEAVQDDALHYGEYEGIQLEVEEPLRPIVEEVLPQEFVKKKAIPINIDNITLDNITDERHPQPPERSVESDDIVIRTAILTGTGSSLNSVYYNLDSINVDGVESEMVLPIESTDRLVDASLTINGVSYELDSWIDSAGTETTINSNDGYSISFTTDNNYVKIKWNNTESNGGFDITDTDDIIYKYWAL